MSSKFTRLKSGFSENRRIPRLGKIRLGLKMQKRRTDGSAVEYPSETDYFVCPPEVHAVYGEQPTELDIMLPNDDPAIVFPQSLAWFGTSKGLKCKGDGETAERLNDSTGAWEPRTCPCEHYKSKENPKGECTENAILITILPKVSMGGTYQIRTGSYHSVVDLNSALDYIRALIGRISMVPLKLRRVPRETHKDGRKATHYTLALVLDANIEGVNQLRNDTKRILSSAQLQIEAPIEDSPLADAPDVIVEDHDEAIQHQETVLAEVQAKLHAKLDKPEDGAATVIEHPVHTQKGSDAPAPNYAMTDEQWMDALTKIDEIPEWAQIKTAVKTRLKITDLRRVMPGKRGEVLGEILREGNAAGMVIAL